MSLEDVERAILDSIRESRTVDMPEWDSELRHQLFGVCDDCNLEEREYWGTNDDGDHWRIRIVDPREPSRL